MTKSPEVKFTYTGNKERREIWETPMAITNVSQELGMPTRQSVEKKELSPNEIVDIDSRALLKPDCPNVIFGRPHAGEFIPTELKDRLNPEHLKVYALIDRGTGGNGQTEGIFHSENIPSVGTLISRFIVDPNRAPLVDQKPDNPIVPGKMVWVEGGMGEQLFKEGQEPDEAEMLEWGEKLYLPYYNGMMGVIGSLADRRKTKVERILVLDGHSFPTSDYLKPWFKKYGVDEPEKLPMFIIGDQDGKTCDPDIRDAFIEALKKNFEELPEEIKKKINERVPGGLVGVNEPMKGVHNVKFYGQRDKGINALQLECNETAYVHEKDGDYFDMEYDEEVVQAVRKLVEKTCLDIDPILKK